MVVSKGSKKRVDKKGFQPKIPNSKCQIVGVPHECMVFVIVFLTIAAKALSLCVVDGASSEELLAGTAVSEVSQPLQPPSHVAGGLWRIGPAARRFLRRCCLASLLAAGVGAATGVAISFAEFLGHKEEKPS